MEGWIDRWEWMDGWIDRWMGMDGWMDGINIDDDVDSD